MAKRTVKNCIDQVRNILQDEIDPYRYATSQLLEYFNNGQYELKRIRPDVWLGGYGVDLTLYTESDYDTEIPFASTFFQPMVLFIAGYAELRDDEFTTDARAATLLTAFSRQLSTPSWGLSDGA